MKLAILSDINSNVYALQAVLDDAKDKNVEAIINLGNSLYGPIAPRQTYDLIRQNNLINICGNKDREILEASLDQLEKNELLRFVYEELGEDALYWIQDLGFEKLIGKDFYLVHGTYFDDSQNLLEDIKDSQVILRDDEEIIKLTDNIKSIFIMCGHSHIPRVHNLSSGQIAINPGSVGLQAYKSDLPSPHKVQNNTPEASYAILDINNDGEYKIEHLRVSYDYEEAIKLAKQRNQEDWAYSLETGKVLEDK